MLFVSRNRISRNQIVTTDSREEGREVFSSLPVQDNKM